MVTTLTQQFLDCFTFCFVFGLIKKGLPVFTLKGFSYELSYKLGEELNLAILKLISDS